MNFRRSALAISTIVAVLIIPITSIPGALATNTLPSGMVLFTAEKRYTAGERVELLGQIQNYPIVTDLVLFSVFSPDQERVLTSRQTLGSETLRFSFTIDSKETRTGEWTINVKYGDLDENATFLMVEEGLFDSAILNRPVLHDSQGNELAPEEQRAGQRLVITAELENDESEQQPYVFLVQVIDVNGATAMFSVTTGTLQADTTATPSVNWEPAAAGVYSVEVMVWSSLGAPVALDSKQSSTFEILA